MNSPTGNVKTLAPGGTIGIVGCGQLGRMIAMAAAQLGYRCHVFGPGDQEPAALPAADFTAAAYDDADALAAFAQSCDVLTYEWENLPIGPLKAAAAHAPLFPGIAALEVAQSRLAEKNFVAKLGGMTADFATVDGQKSLETAVEAIGLPAILKTDRMGYDGKGQFRLQSPDDGKNAWQGIGEQPAILESFVSFTHEFSIILVRGQDGAIRFWDAPHNVHEDGILRRSMVPAPGPVAIHIAAARATARRIAEKLDYVGVLTLEFFATPQGPVFNEMAPRVHNSGHWTIEGAVTSQFENHVRAICGLPLGSTQLTGDQVEMHNLIGDDAAGWPELFADDGAHVHLYGKREARAGRKMGHMTRVLGNMRAQI